MERPSPSAVYSSLKGKVVLVTGGASGIGEAIVEAFVLQGSRVLFIDIQHDAANSLVQRLQQPSCVPPEYLHCDLTNNSELQSVIEKILSAHPAIDVLVNNAGDDKRPKLDEGTSEYGEWGRHTNPRPQF